MPRGRGGKDAVARQLAAAVAAAQVVPRIMRPAAAPPTVRQNPRRDFRLYMSTSPSDKGLVLIAVDDLWSLLSVWSSGNRVQINTVQMWGPSGLASGSGAASRLHAVHTPTGVDGDDRSALESTRPRVGFSFPAAARVVYHEGDTTELFAVTIQPPTSKELDVLFHVTVW